MRLARPTPSALGYDRTPEPLSPPSMRTDCPAAAKMRAACPSGARMRVASPWPTSMQCTWRSRLGAEVVTVVSGAEVTTVVEEVLDVVEAGVCVGEVAAVVVVLPSD